MNTDRVIPFPYDRVADTALSTEPGRWRESVASGTLTVFAIVAPLLAALGLFVRSTHRGLQDLLPLVAVGLLLPALRLWRSLSVRRSAMVGVSILFVAAFLLISRFGFAAGLSVVVVVTCVLGVIIFGRGMGFVMIGAAAFAYVAIGVLVGKGILRLAAPEVDPLLLRNWLRLAASTSLLSALLASVVDFVIRHVEANARATATALEELRAAYDALRGKEERYRSLVDHCLDGVLLTNPSGEILEANPAFCRMVGRTAEEICALGREGVVDPEDPRLARLLEERRQTGTMRGELTMVRSDGRKLPVEVFSAMFTDRHGELRTSMSVRDLTDRKRVERDQRLLAELGVVMGPLHQESSLNDVAPLLVRDFADLGVFYLVQPDGELRRAAAATRDPAKAWIAEVVMRLPTTPSAEHVTRQVLRERKPLIRALVPKLVEEQAETPEHLRALRAAALKSSLLVPLLVGDSCVGVMGLASASEPFEESDLPLAVEIGRRCALFTESARLRHSERRATHTRDEVLAIVAHDLRNPLGSFMMQLALLRRSHGLPERRSLKPVDALERAVMRMSRTLEDLVEVTEFEFGRLNLARARVPAGDFIVEVVEALREQAVAFSLELHGHVPHHVPDVWADKSRILQVLENLVGNAMKFTPHGSISLGARAEGSEVVFWVADTGVGIAAEDLPHVFDRFWQGKKSARAGSGLGLAIVNGIVQAHGGRVWVDSKLGSGSTFFFSLPMGPV
jgi:PAS domain S-box-containing protein